MICMIHVAQIHKINLIKKKATVISYAGALLPYGGAPLPYGGAPLPRIFLWGSSAPPPLHHWTRVTIFFHLVRIEK